MDDILVSNVFDDLFSQPSIFVFNQANTNETLTYLPFCYDLSSTIRMLASTI